MLVGEEVHLLLGALCGVTQHQLAVGLADGKVATLAVVDGAHAQFRGIGCAGGGEPAGDAGIRGGAQVVAIAHRRVAESLLQQLVQHTGTQQRRVQITVAGRAPLQRRVGRPLGRRQVLGQQLRLLVLDEVQRQALDGQLRVLLQRGQGVVLGPEGVHQEQGHPGAVVLAGGQHLLDDDVQEGLPVAHLQQVLGLVQAHRRAQAAVELDDGGAGHGLTGRFLTDLDVVEHRRSRQRLDRVLPDQASRARFQLPVVVAEHLDGGVADPRGAHLVRGLCKTVVAHEPDPRGERLGTGARNPRQLAVRMREGDAARRAEAVYPPPGDMRRAASPSPEEYGATGLSRAWKAAGQRHLQPLISPLVGSWAAGDPGRIRTSDTRFRKPLLYPLSYRASAPARSRRS